jgi:hypothetical protein
VVRNPNPGSEFFRILIFLLFGVSFTSVYAKFCVSDECWCPDFTRLLLVSGGEGQAIPLLSSGQAAEES